MTSVLYLDHLNKVGGAQLFLLELIKNLDKSRFVSYCLEPIDPKMKHKLQEIGNGLLFLDCQFSEFRTLNPGKLLLNFYQVLKLIKCIRKKDIDVLFANSFPGQIIGRMIRRMLSKPLICYVHDNHIDRRLLKWSLKNTDLILTNSSYMKDYILKETLFSEKKIKVIPNGFDFSLLKGKKAALQKKNNDIIFGIFGRIVKWKGHRILIDLAEEIVKQRKNVHFMVVGDGEEDYVNKLKDIVHSRKLTKYVTFTGYCENVLQMMMETDIILNLSLIPEPFGRTVIEAGALGKPIIAFNSGGPSEIVKNHLTGYLVEPNNIDQLVETAMELIHNEILREKVGMRAKDHIMKNYSMDRVVQSIENQILKCIPD